MTERLWNILAEGFTKILIPCIRITIPLTALSFLLGTLLALALSTILNTFCFARTIIRLYTPGTPLSSATVWKAQAPFGLSAICFSLLNLAAGIFASPLIGLLRQGLEYFGKVG